MKIFPPCRSANLRSLNNPYPRPPLALADQLRLNNGVSSILGIGWDGVEAVKQSAPLSSPTRTKITSSGADASSALSKQGAVNSTQSVSDRERWRNAPEIATSTRPCRNSACLIFPNNIPLMTLLSHFSSSRSVTSSPDRPVSPVTAFLALSKVSGDLISCINTIRLDWDRRCISTNHGRSGCKEIVIL